MQKLIDQAIEKYNSGLIQEAISITNLLIKDFPKNYIGYKIRGVLLNKINQPSLALIDMLKAFDINSMDHENINNIAVLYYEQKDNSNAVNFINKAIKINSSNSTYWTNAGNIHYENNQYNLSKEAYMRAIKIDPYNEKANIHIAQPIAFIESIDIAEKVLVKYLEEKNIIAIEIIGNIYYKKNMFDKALEYFSIGYTDCNSISSAINISKIYLDQSKYKEAFDILNLIKSNKNINSNYDQFIINFITACTHLGKFKEIILIFDIKLAKQKDLVYAAMAGLLYKVGDISTSIKYYEKSIQLNNKNWLVRSNYLFTLAHSSNKTPEEVYKLHIIFGQDINQKIKQNLIFQNKKLNNDQEIIKIGFISADFKEHAAMKFFLTTIKNINLIKFHIYIYDNNFPNNNHVLKEIKEKSTKYDNIFNKADPEVNSIILNDKLDIMIDLSGHTSGNRLPLLAMRLAPIQMTWIGYPNTTGLKQIDYVICDKYNMPPNLFDKYWIEKPFYLNSAYIFDTEKIDVPISQSPCLTNGYITFGSFNRTSKISDDCLAAWANILLLVENSLLKIGNVEDSETINHFNKVFSGFGIDLKRVYYLNRMPIIDYLKSHNSIDIILDTWPYTGGTTTYYAIWMGVPVMTISGNTRVTNQSASILRRQNLDFMISQNTEEYIKNSINFSHNFKYLNSLRITSRFNWKNNINNNLMEYIQDFEEKISILVSRSWQPSKTTTKSTT